MAALPDPEEEAVRVLTEAVDAFDSALRVLLRASQHKREHDPTGEYRANLASTIVELKWTLTADFNTAISLITGTPQLGEAPPASQ